MNQHSFNEWLLDKEVKHHRCCDCGSYCVDVRDGIVEYWLGV